MIPAMPAGMIVDDVLDYMHASKDAAARSRVWQVLRVQYFEICSRYSWANLRKTVTLDFSTATSGTGLYLPGDLCGIDMVRDTDDDFEFFERNRADIEPDEYGYRYYRYKPLDTPLFYGTDLVLENGASSFTSASLTSAGTVVTNEYVRFGKELGIYKITNTATPFTFTPAYYGPKLNGPDIGTFTIRPKESEKMVILDAAEEVLEDRSVDLHYCKLPQPLYKPDDVIALPTSEVLKLKVLRELPEAKVLRPVSERELDGALQEALRMNPDFVRNSNPRDKHNSIFDFSRNPFKQRGS